jgi:hypothetical protein
MRYVESYLNEMISSPSLSIHGEDITSQEATETFEEVLKCSNSVLDELTEEQKSLLKEKCSAGKACVTKIDKYRQGLVLEKMKSDTEAQSFRQQLRQGELEKEAEL